MIITDVIFDLGNVLVPFDWRIAVHGLLEHLPRDLAEKAGKDPKVLALAISDIIEALEIGSINFEEFHGQVVARTGLTTDASQFRRIWCEIFSVDVEMTRLGQLLTRRYDVWLASNTDEAHFSYIIEKFPEVLFYKKAALSYKMGIMKPDQGYFVKALELFGIEPEQALFIDDLLENVQAARKLGITGIQFTNYRTLLGQLAELGLQESSLPRRYSIE
ncbi:MAG: HAD family phosphatase [Deltaproteobacteria bacterium]|nr:HAD family phosphatase [Deltaproteobacteria bacterium]